MRHLVFIYFMAVLGVATLPHCSSKKGNKTQQGPKEKASNGVKTPLKKTERTVSSKIRMELRKIHDNIYMARGVNGLPSVDNKGFMSNSYGILTSEGWFVVDALTTPKLSELFIQMLKREKNVPIKYLVITHYHQDHWYGAQSYQAIGTQIIAHKNLKASYEGNGKAILAASHNRFKIYANVKLTPPTIVIDKESKKFKMGAMEIEVLPFTPAHTNTDLVVYLPKEEVMFVGDMVNKGRIPFAGDRTASSRGWIKYLEKMKTYKIKMLLTGHNDPLAKSDIDFNLGYLKYMRKEITRMKDEGLSINEVKAKLLKTPYTKGDKIDFFHNLNIYAFYNKIGITEMLEEGNE
ncbi:MAG: MBL fold metallo-hydrolase [bacterium]|nr:MAG: MBL fold metallo-hydrolase [bacterium]